MKYVYVVMSERDYEGEEVRGVFERQQEADACAKSLAGANAVEFSGGYRNPFGYVTYRVTEWEVL